MSDATLVIEISAKVASLKSGMAEAQTAVKKFSAELKSTGVSGAQSVEHVAGAFKKLENESLSSGKAIAAKFESELSGAAAKVEKYFSEVGKEAGKTLQDLGGEFSKSGGIFSRISGSLGGIAGAAGPIGMVGAALAAAGAASAGVASKLADMTQESEHLAEAAGMSMTKLVEWKGVLAQAGVPAERVTMMMQRMGTALFEAVVEKQSTEVKAFQELGVSQKDLAATGGDVNKVLLMMSTKLQHTKMSAMALGAASELLGRNSAQLVGVLRQGPKVIQEEMSAYKTLGQQEERSKDAANQFKAAENVLFAHMEGVGFPILRAMPSIINGAARAWDTLKAAVQVWWDVVSPEVKGIGSVVAEMGQLIWKYIGGDVVKAFHLYERAALDAGKVVVATFATAGATATAMAEAVRDAVHGNFSEAWKDVKGIPQAAEESYRDTVNKIIADTKAAGKASDEFKKQVAASAMTEEIAASEMHTPNVEATTRGKKKKEKHAKDLTAEQGSFTQKITEGMNHIERANQNAFEKQTDDHANSLMKQFMTKVKAIRQEAKAQQEHNQKMLDEQVAFSDKMAELKFAAQKKSASAGGAFGFVGGNNQVAGEIAAVNQLYSVKEANVRKEMALEASYNGTQTVQYRKLQNQLALLDQQRLAKIQDIKNQEVQLEKQKNQEIAGEMQQAFMRRYGFQNMMAEKANAIIRNSMASAMSLIEAKLGLQMATDKKSQLSSAKKGASKAAAEFPFPLNIAAGAATFAALMAFKGGGIVPETSIAMVHKNEMVLPQHIASFVKRGAEMQSGEAPGGAGGIHLHYSPSVHAIDTQGASEFFNKHADFAAAALHKYFRQRNRT